MCRQNRSYTIVAMLALSLAAPWARAELKSKEIDYKHGDTPMVGTGRLAAMGYCFGGQVALELARSGADLKGVVTFHGALDTPTPQDAKNIKGKVLACHGEADPHVPDDQANAFRKEMNDAKVDWFLVAYGGAVHGFTNPDNKNSPMKGVAYDEKADRRSWQAMRDFFDEIFGSGAGAAG